ncbi:vitamin D3 hydroxylase-associated protein-like [Pyxicephalus adspersus]|uniref:vitamin D3 hydroxylase-associated protein-like n=1 Tax=Pyxicephalus adspersus TaxID=30357 RepID=UPI003B5A0AEC
MLSSLRFLLFGMPTAHLLVAILCCVVAGLLIIHWMDRRRCHQKIESARVQREHAVQLMEKAVLQYLEQVRYESGFGFTMLFNILNFPAGVLPVTTVSAEDEEELRHYKGYYNDLWDKEFIQCCWRSCVVTGGAVLLVLNAIHPQALEVHNDVNCLTVFMSDCETQLKKLQERGDRGPLYGVPVSIKEQVGYQGQHSTCGLVQYLDVLEEEDSVIVKVLKKQGAIVFAETNVPQTLICMESSNPIYGGTLNPHNKAKGCAGSTGGEGALIGGGGSILGIGTDIGGSIRLPSSFCGIAGFKPSPKRLSIRGVRPCVDGMTMVSTCIGPMARDVDGVVLAMKALLCEEMFRLDPNVPPIPFNEEMFSSKKNLRIGYIEEDGFFKPNPSMSRVVLETKNLLEGAGHELIPFRPPRVDHVFDLFIKAVLGDGGRTLGDKLFCALLLLVVSCDGFLLVFLQEYQAEFIGEWRKLDLDLLICPMLGPAFNVGYAGKLLACASFTALYNMLQFPAGVLPVGSVTTEDEEALKHYKGYENDHWDKLFRKAVSDGVGLPLSVQCVALPYQDELCLRLMMEVQTLHREKTIRGPV